MDSPVPPNPSSRPPEPDAAESRPVPVEPRTRRRDRHGRGMRGPVAPPQVPLSATRADTFRDLVLDSVERLERRWPQLADVEFMVLDVPPSVPGESVPLGGAAPAEKGGPPGSSSIGGRSRSARRAVTNGRCSSMRSWWSRWPSSWVSPPSRSTPGTGRTDPFGGTQATFGGTPAAFRRTSPAVEGTPAPFPVVRGRWPRRQPSRRRPSRRQPSRRRPSRRQSSRTERSCFVLGTCTAPRSSARVWTVNMGMPSCGSTRARAAWTGPPETRSTVSA